MSTYFGHQRGEAELSLYAIASVQIAQAITRTYPILMDGDQRDSELLLKTVRAIGRAYELSATELSRITGIKAGDLARTNGEEGKDTLTAKQTQAAQEMLRLYKELSALFGQDDSAASRWLRTKNLDFDARPIDLIKTADGLERVRQYLRDYHSRS